MYIRVSYSDRAELHEAEAVINNFAQSAPVISGTHRGQCIVTEIKDADFEAFKARMQAANDRIKIEY